MNKLRSVFPLCDKLQIALLVLCCLLLNSWSASAQEQAVTQTYLSRLSGADGTLSNSAVSELDYAPQGELGVTIKNVITLSINEESQTFIPANFSATVNLKIEYATAPGAAVQTIASQSLVVTYNTQGKFNPKQYINFSGAGYVKVTVLSVTPSSTMLAPTNLNPATLLVLQNEMRVARYFELTPGGSLQPGLSSSPVTYPSDPGTPAPDEVTINWTWPSNAGNNGTQLEWAWLEDDLAVNYLNPDASINYNLLFQNNSTRVDLPLDASSYNIPLLYDGIGKLYYRIRAVNFKNSGSRSDGPWSAVQSVTFNGHEPSFNWQVTTSFAEDGKRKSVIQYFDGSLRQRQTVTKDNSTNTTVTAETFYDGQGRPAVQVLPAPGIDNIIHYQEGLNLFNGQTMDQDPAMAFDLQAMSVKNPAIPTPLTTAALDASSRTSVYYSPANTELTLDANQNIPNAGGYPYSVAYYTPDATGRIMSQSGVGPSMKPGSGHETKYYYGTAPMEQLDGLFGTEVGNNSHYFKNMVQDANGQMSVSYVDMHGRTIATALAGDAANLKSLDLTQYPGQAGATLNQNLLANDANIVKGNSVEALNSLLVPVGENYSFIYSLNPQALQMAQCTGSPVCYDCMYNLDITITDESGGQAPVIRRFDNLSLSAGNNCSGLPLKDDQFSIGDVSTVADTTVTFSVFLSPGSYSVRKTLTVSDAAQQTLQAQYLQTALACPGQSEQAIVDSLYQVLKIQTGCALPPSSNPCQDCMTAIGASYTDFRTKYLQNMSGISVNEQDIQNAYNAAMANCNALNTSAGSFQSLTIIANLMLADMMPYTGQYAKNGSLVLPPLPSMYSRYDIFANGKFRTPAGGNYLDPNGNPDPSVNSVLSSISPDGFDGIFAPSWAQQLLPYHPEYGALVFAQQHMKDAYNWIDAFNAETTLVNAHTNSGGTSENLDPYFAMDPAGKAILNTYETTPKYYNNLSMWQIAYGSVACASITNLDDQQTCFTSAPMTPPFSGLTTDQQNQVWNTYKNMYTMVRDSLMNIYIVGQASPSLSSQDQTNLVGQGYILRFPTTFGQQVQQYNQPAGQPYGFSSFPAKAGDAPSIDPAVAAAAMNTSKCSSYIQRWMETLSTCPALAARSDAAQIIAEITSRMEAVCEKGLDEANPNGSSNVVPGKISSTPGADNNFEDVVRNVFAEKGMSEDQFCNPFIIDYPKPYDSQLPISKPMMTVVDSCACNRFSQITQDAIAHGVDVTSLTTLNTYLNVTYHDVLTQVEFDGLQQCSILGSQQTKTEQQQVMADCGSTQAEACGFSAKKAALTTTVSTAPQCPFSCPFTATVGTIWYYPLSSPQPKPAFLECGYIAPGPQCVTCAQLGALTKEYKSIFTGMNCAAAPVTTGGLTPDQVGYNITYAQFLNYRTGLQLDWTDYARLSTAVGCDLGNDTADMSMGQTVICPKSLDDTTGLIEMDTVCEKARQMAIAEGHDIYEQRVAQLIANFQTAYLAKCLSVANIEHFKVSYTSSEYHYTLYYYDQAGLLLKTVPPKGARPDFSLAFVNSVEAARLTGAVVMPSHLLVTNYRYNSLNAVVAQNTPDAGTSLFWYDLVGRLAVSQNAQQNADVKYSYTKYDPLGRIIEVGQIPQSTLMTQAVSQSPGSLVGWLNMPTEQMTHTVYDQPQTNVFDPSLFPQLNVRNRVSYTYTLQSSSTANWDMATFYSYDVHGNVSTLMHDFLGVTGIDPAKDQYKYISYNYDLISNKVNGVDYQHIPAVNATSQPTSAPDAFYHRYLYDAENRIVEVMTSRDSIVWERDASYNYYKHGPLSRTVLGQLQVQGIDYTYTLQGWLKGINVGSGFSGDPGSGSGGSGGSGTSCPPGAYPDDLDVTSRPATGGPDVYTARNSISFEEGFTSLDNDLFSTDIDNTLPGCNVTGGSPPPVGFNGPDGYPMAQDAYNVSLHYYPGDFTPIGTTTPITDLLQALSSQAAPLYNGNIAAMAVNVSNLVDPTSGQTDARVYNYHYDQLNRLLSMDAYKGLNMVTHVFTPVALQDYQERAVYDPNGNILTYTRNGYSDATHNTAMDNLTYHYNHTANNQLSSIHDVAGGSYTNDIKDNMPADGSDYYHYDKIGNLTSEGPLSSPVNTITWNVYGKILTQTGNSGAMSYIYDPAGNRVLKTVSGTNTLYVRDPQGNTLTTYLRTGSGAYQQTEVDLYGSTRLGALGALTVAPSTLALASGFGNALVSTFTRGEHSYELTNHLGNVLATITDRKIAVSSSSDGSLIDHFTPDVATAQDYYPFGMQMPGRTYTAPNATNYRYGFNGKENVNEVNGVGNQVDYGMRIYDPRIGKFLSVDPLEKKYPWYTPYQFAGNKPIAFIDVDGLEDQWAADGQHMQGPVLANTTAGQMLYNHPPQPGNPIITYSRGQSITKDPNPAYQYFSWNGIGGPSQITQSVFGNALFKKGFDNYLPKRFIDHYELAGGQPYVMNRQEMNDVNMRSIGIEGGGTDASGGGEMARFQNAIKGLKVGETRNVKNWQILTGAYNSGTLGNFYATVNGTFTGVNNKDGSAGWVFQGTLQMNDYWDFDPDPTGQKRPSLAEGLVRFANKYLLGKPFSITSVPVPVNQTSNQNTFDYSTNPKIIPNRVASGVSDEQKTGDASGSGKPQ